MTDEVSAPPPHRHAHLVTTRNRPGARLLSVCLCVLCLCAPVPHALAQKSGPPAEKAARPRREEAKGAEKPEAAARRQQALWLLDGVEAKARKLQPGILQVRTLAEVADTLWPHDEARARALFAEAFQAIDSVKLDPEKDQRARLAAAHGGLGPLADLRAEVLRAVAAHDFKLAEKLRQGVKEPEAGAGGENQPAWPGEKEELAWDIAIASAGTQPERTAQFVRGQLRKGVGEELGPALVAIRRENPQLAEQLFAESLAAARAGLGGREGLEALAAYVLPAGHDEQDRGLRRTRHTRLR